MSDSLPALENYQDAGYANRYRRLVETVKNLEQEKCPGHEQLSLAVAKYAYKLMAYKDEYEVARLYCNDEFKNKLEQQFQGDYKLKFHLAPPLLSRKNDQGQAQKMTFPGWALHAFRFLARFRFLRGTALDPFGYTEERKTERQLIVDYRQTVSQLLETLDVSNYALALEIITLPEIVRGYGHVKQATLEKARSQKTVLMDRFLKPGKTRPRAIELAG